MTEPPSPLTMLLSRHTKRREFITLLGGAAAAWPLAARAQQPAMPVIGFLSTRLARGRAHIAWRAFRQGLREAGYVEGRERGDRVSLGGGPIRSTAGAGGRSGSPAGRRDRRTGGAPAAACGKGGDRRRFRSCSLTGDDPVQLGLVASLGRPGGNVTGVTSLNVELGPKRLELLHELVPTATHHWRCSSTRAIRTQPRLIREKRRLRRAALGLANPRRARQHRARHRHGLCDAWSNCGPVRS